ncbi:reverse transcriptase domain-containing protein [Tanacetum coccineum]
MFPSCPTPQIQGVSKMDFENYVKENDAVLKNNSASTSNLGTLPSQTVTNPRQQINAITTRSGKTLEGPSTPLVPTPVISNSQKEPKQNLETSTEKVQNPNLENTAQVPPWRKEESISLNPKPKARKPLYWIKRCSRRNGLRSTNCITRLAKDKEKLEEIAITTVNAECSAIIMNKVPEKLEDPGKFLIPCALQELDRTSALADSGASINLLPHSIYKKLAELRVDGFTFLADFVVVNFEPDPRVPIILGRPFLRTAKALIDLYEETLTLRVGKEELVYYACADELAPLDSLPLGNDDSTLKKDLHEENFQVFSNPLFEFDDNFKSSNVNPLFEEKDKDVEIKFLLHFTLIHQMKGDLELSWRRSISTRELILPSLPPLKFQVAILLPLLSPERRKMIICLLAKFLNKKPKPLSRPQEVEEIKIEEDKVSSDILINTIVMPIKTTFDNPIDFNDHFFKSKDLAVAFDSTESSILPPPLLDSDSPFTAELSASITLNSLRNEDKVFKPGILVYHAIHDKKLVTLEKNLRENISSGTLLVFKEPSFLLPPPKPLDSTRLFHGSSCVSIIILGWGCPKGLKHLHEDGGIAKKERYGYIKNHKKTVKNGQTRTRERRAQKKPEMQSQSQEKSKSQSCGQPPVNLVTRVNLRTKLNITFEVLQVSKDYTKGPYD